MADQMVESHPAPETELAHRVQRRVDLLPVGLQSHIYRVRDIAQELAEHHGAEPARAALGMLAHDVARAMTNRELMHRAERLGLPIGPVERVVPLLLHGPVGAEILRLEDGLNDTSIYRAAYWHTTAHSSLDPLGKVVFLADKLDPQKLAAYPYQAELMELALENLDLAILEFLTREAVSLMSRGQMVHPIVVETRNYLLESLQPTK